MTTRFSRPTRSLLLVSLALATAGLAACGGGDDGGNGGDGDSSDLPKNAVAVVGDREITRDQLDEQVEAVQRSMRGASKAELKANVDQAKQQALSQLIQLAAYEQEASERGVTVSDEQARERLETARESFPSAKAFKRFLGKQTEEDLLAQLRLQLISEAIEADAKKKDENPAKVLAKLREEISKQLDKER